MEQQAARKDARSEQTGKLPVPHERSDIHEPSRDSGCASWIKLKQRAMSHRTFLIGGYRCARRTHANTPMNGHEIGSDVWVGGGAIICPGVRIGPRSVVGAGSVVTRDVPEGVFAAGNPCRVNRKIAE